MRTHWLKSTALTLVAATSFGVFALTAPVQAGSTGRKNTAIALGALAAEQLLTGKTTTGIIAGAGGLYAYSRYKDAKKKERYEDRYWSRERHHHGHYRW
ncbi:MAG TPA: hypothetical protein VGN26_18595 [Armatimonadota bacterium]|jgi:uncharacterized membrane protein YebE (DUF533 family)